MLKMTTQAKSTTPKSTVGEKGASSKKLSATGRPLPPNAGKGRPKGSQNKENKMLREMILQALDRNGGVEYLAMQAVKEPKAFLSLLGRVLPLQVTGEGGGPVDANITVTFK